MLIKKFRERALFSLEQRPLEKSVHFPAHVYTFVKELNLYVDIKLKTKDELIPLNPCMMFYGAL